MRSNCLRITLCLLLIHSAGNAWADDPKNDTRAEILFERHIRPLLISKCLKCHGKSKQEGGLRLDSREAILRGGESGPAIIPKRPDASLLVEALKYESLEMPPSGRLESGEIRRVVDWIQNGAVWPRRTSQLRPGSFEISDADRRWWAFQPPSLKMPPAAADGSVIDHPIDAFVQHRFRDTNIVPAPQADRATLVRRLYFDLIGLPPRPEDVDQYIASQSSSSWDDMVDRLLADPRHGEHWARHWLDVVRYAESDGWNQDAYRPHVWRYRDYVIDSFNTDKPYPQFVREQLSGDELPGDNPAHLIATGFLRLGIYEYNQRDARTHWNSIMNELTDTVGDVFFGMSLACAKCHDHKFDPLSQRDYFRLRAYLEPIIFRDDLIAATTKTKREYAAQIKKWEAATGSIREEIDALVTPYHQRKWKSTVDKFPLDIQACFHKPVKDRTSWEHQMAYLVSRQFSEEGGGPLKNISKKDQKRLDELNRKLASFEHLKPMPLPPLMAVQEFPGRPSPTQIPDSNEETVQPDKFTVLQSESGSASHSQNESAAEGRRSALAAWITHRENHLANRVIVNRVWQYHFGRGLVSTPNDFGRLGEKPSHPDLLDYLTNYFVQTGGSFKKLHKLIVTSNTWKQSAQHPRQDEFRMHGPAERLLWRAAVRRLTAEQIRDAMLFVSGQLQNKIGGPSVAVDVPRRSIYVKRMRNTPAEILHAFDVADGLKSVSVRGSTTTPTQSLMMMNGAFVLDCATKLAMRVKSEEKTLEKRIQRAIYLCWGRAASDSELQKSIAYLQQNGKTAKDQQWIDFCHVLLNSNEFLYID